MNALNKYISFLLLLLLLVSCSKDVIEPLPQENGPVFEVTGQIDGNAFSLSAGVSGAYMNTSTTLKNNVKQFKGSLENAQTGFSISFLDGMIDIPSLNSNIEDFETFKIAPYTYGEALANYSIQSFPNSEYIDDVEWSVDGEIKTGSTLEFYEPGKYEVCASIMYTDGSESYACNEVLVGYQKNATSMLRHMITQNQNTIAFLDSPDAHISSIDWSINDSVVATSSSENYMTDNLNLDYYRLGANVTFQNGVVRKKEIFVNTQNINNYIGDFSTLENQSNIYWDHSATIIVRHNQKEYRAIQNGSNTAVITINDVDTFNNNSSGNQVSIFKGTLDCSFIDLSTEEIVDGVFEFTFGIAH